jgi:Gas vesicle synthesis protein GvpL/GvpF
MSFHLYGIVAEGASLPSTVRGRQDAPLQIVGHGRLAAIVSEVDPDARVHREDLLAHAHVLEAIVEDTTVLPMRFGMILGSEDELSKQVLQAGESRLLSLLDEFDGLQQLAVKAVHDEEEVLRFLLEQDSQVRAFRDSVVAGGAMREANLELGQMVARGIEAIERMDAAMLIDELAPLVREIKVEDSSKRKNVLDAALLVRRADRAQVDKAIADVIRRLPPRLRLRYVGPQPPYAFIDIALAGEPVWA